MFAAFSQDGRIAAIKCCGAGGRLSWDTVGRRAGVADGGGEVSGGFGTGHFQIGCVGFDVVRWPGWLIFTLGSSKMGIKREK